MTEDRFSVEYRTDEGRYALVDRGEDGSGSTVIGEESYADFATDDGVDRILFHTFVSEEYGGQGLASTLVRSAVEHAISLGHRVVPVCSYVAAWLQKHGEYAEHVVAIRPEHLKAVSAQRSTS